MKPVLWCVCLAGLWIIFVTLPEQREADAILAFRRTHEAAEKACYERNSQLYLKSDESKPPKGDIDFRDLGALPSSVSNEISNECGYNPYDYTWYAPPK